MDWTRKQPCVTIGWKTLVKALTSVVWICHVKATFLALHNVTLGWKTLAKALTSVVWICHVKATFLTLAVSTV